MQNDINKLYVLSRKLLLWYDDQKTGEMADHVNWSRLNEIIIFQERSDWWFVWQLLKFLHKENSTARLDKF